MQTHLERHALDRLTAAHRQSSTAAADMMMTRLAHAIGSVHLPLLLVLVVMALAPLVTSQPARDRLMERDAAFSAPLVSPTSAQMCGPASWGLPLATGGAAPTPHSDPEEWLRGVDLASPQYESKLAHLAQRPVIPAQMRLARYSRAVADKLRWHSVTAYTYDLSAIADWTCRSCKQFGKFTTTAVMKKDSHQGYVGYFTQGLPASPIDDGTGRVQASDPFVVVSFRGTVPSNIPNWIYNFMIDQQVPFSDQYPDVEVHHGFWRAYVKNLKREMLLGVADALEKSGAKTIIFTGHSLGAALANIAALDLRLTKYHDHHIAVYTQGAPRIGNDAFALLFSQLIDANFREVRHRDIVPRVLPPQLDYQHAPMEVYYAHDFDTYRVCNSSVTAEDQTCSAGVFNRIRDMVPNIHSIHDHIIYDDVFLAGFNNQELA